MSAKIINGIHIATAVKHKVRGEINQLKQQNNRPPGLAVVLVGDDAASQVYVKYKKRACKEVGIQSFTYNLDKKTQEKELVELVDKLNKDPKIDGILVQLPLPSHLDNNTVINHISPNKDVDGFHPVNMGRLALNLPCLRPCTPKGVITLLQTNNIKITGKHAVVIGASNIVGRPMMLELLAQNATVTICHSKTKNLKKHINNADILVVAVGIAHFIKAKQIKKNAVVIDVGINRLPDGSLTGDVDYIDAKKRASFITPVPGGVGPMTIASLMDNTLIAYKGIV
ncbi:MAG: bifunctional methylenetetrahydrofolate dehydrogenase/methenyltetrahydrofolate cyclohydrolase FolD [Gammaproteobacteria bacterium]|nr:bifunctional methylenetetrahydrofolate dehydrogenase/methenyltetrahydrofolate cyclohydrolase FolD [Gammaproteobacteria bacterium]